MFKKRRLDMGAPARIYLNRQYIVMAGDEARNIGGDEVVFVEPRDGDEFGFYVRTFFDFHGDGTIDAMASNSTLIVTRNPSPGEKPIAGLWKPWPHRFTICLPDQKAVDHANSPAALTEFKKAVAEARAKVDFLRKWLTKNQGCARGDACRSEPGKKDIDVAFFAGSEAVRLPDKSIAQLDNTCAQISIKASAEIYICGDEGRELGRMISGNERKK